MYVRTYTYVLHTEYRPNSHAHKVHTAKSVNSFPRLSPSVPQWFCIAITLTATLRYSSSSSSSFLFFLVFSSRPPPLSLSFCVFLSLSFSLVLLHISISAHVSRTRDVVNAGPMKTPIKTR